MLCVLLANDHKKGELKGRPIHAATDTPATRLSTFLVRSLNNILAHVPAHLKNTQEFIDFISSLDDIKGFCSRDVCNLYGSIPLEDLEDGTPGIFTVIRDFFSTYKSATVLEHLSDDDFVSLLCLCITSDVVLIEGTSHSQNSGLAMSNNLAPTLAIIYINNLDLEIQSSFNNSVHLKRYFDDMFIAWTKDNLTPDEMVTTANSVNTAFKFTVEIPEDNCLPFLDTIVTLHTHNGRFSTKLYMKPIHSQCITPWDSHGPISQKRGILIGEIRRAMSRSTDPRSQQNSLRLITMLYTKNGYPRSFIKSTIKRTLRKCKSQPSEQEQRLIYMKMPFINDDIKRQTQAVSRWTGQDNIRVHYINGSSSSRIFTPSKEKQCCPDPCATCGSSTRSNQCLTKNCVYKIKCSHCDTVYIGETSRTVGSRIKEHIRMVKQTVYSHLINHNIRFQKMPMFPDDVIYVWQIGIVNFHKWEKPLGGPCFLFE
ncbi:uncharacterized protein [Montipora foliosa]|uniref:uncharacterized protein n=1 Tax=Montipora foliosa TaxID=591990 RepID=UPI0035F11B3E